MNEARDVAAVLAGFELRDIDVAFSIIGFLFSAAFGALVWYDRRGRSYVDTNIGSVVEGQTRTHARLDKLEARIGEMEGEMSRADVRLTRIEGRIDTLATKDQVGDLRDRVATMEGVIQKVSGQVDTLYRAALASRPGR